MQVGVRGERVVFQSSRCVDLPLTTLIKIHGALDGFGFSFVGTLDCRYQCAEWPHVYLFVDELGYPWALVRSNLLALIGDNMSQVMELGPVYGGFRTLPACDEDAARKLREAALADHNYTKSTDCSALEFFAECWQPAAFDMSDEELRSLLEAFEEAFDPLYDAAFEERRAEELYRNALWPEAQ